METSFGFGRVGGWLWRKLIGMVADIVIVSWVEREIRPISLRQLTFFGRTLTESRLISSGNYVRTELPTRWVWAYRGPRDLKQKCLTIFCMKIGSRIVYEISNSCHMSWCRTRIFHLFMSCIIKHSSDSELCQRLRHWRIMMNFVRYFARRSKSILWQSQDWQWASWSVETSCLQKSWTSSWIPCYGQYVFYQHEECYISLDWPSLEDFTSGNCWAAFGTDRSF